MKYFLLLMEGKGIPLQKSLLLKKKDVTIKSDEILLNGETSIKINKNERRSFLNMMELNKKSEYLFLM